MASSSKSRQRRNMLDEILSDNDETIESELSFCLLLIGLFY